MEAIRAGSLPKMFGQLVGVDHISSDWVLGSSGRWGPTRRGSNRNLDEMQSTMLNVEGLEVQAVHDGESVNRG